MNKHLLLILSALIIWVGVVGCATTGPGVPVFEGRDIGRPYEEIGDIEASYQIRYIMPIWRWLLVMGSFGEIDYTSALQAQNPEHQAAALEALSYKASAAGADAVVNVHYKWHRVPIQPRFYQTPRPRVTARGAMIRYVDEGP